MSLILFILAYILGVSEILLPYKGSLPMPASAAIITFAAMGMAAYFTKPKPKTRFQPDISWGFFLGLNLTLTVYYFSQLCSPDGTFHRGYIFFHTMWTMWSTDVFFSAWVADPKKDSNG